MYAANRLLNTGALHTGQVAADWTAREVGFGSVLVAGAVIAAAWFLVLKPKSDPATKARAGIRERELAKIKTLDDENRELRRMLGSIDCSVRDAGARGKCGSAA